MKKGNPAVAVCPFMAENGRTIKLKIDPDDNRHILTWYINGADDAKNANDNIQVINANTYTMKKNNPMRAMDRYHRLYRRYIMELKGLNIPQTANLHWMIRKGFSDTEIKNQLGIPWTTIKVFREAYNYKFFM